eukprot:230113-Chlamydomonas_euryale.AAC.2
MLDGWHRPSSCWLVHLRLVGFKRRIFAPMQPMQLARCENHHGTSGISPVPLVPLESSVPRAASGTVNLSTSTSVAVVRETGVSSRLQLT